MLDSSPAPTFLRAGATQSRDCCGLRTRRVVIGGLISGGATYLMVRRQEGAELRQARRLVADELFDIALQLSILLEDRAMPPESSPMRDNPLPSRSWEMDKATLARGLSDTIGATCLGSTAGWRPIGQASSHPAVSRHRHGTDRDLACGDGLGDNALRQTLRNPFCTQGGA